MFKGSQHFGKYAYLFYYQELDEKTDTHLMFIPEI